MLPSLSRHGSDNGLSVVYALCQGREAPGRSRHGGATMGLLLSSALGLTVFASSGPSEDKGGFHVP
jgi:hypothetical protein